MLAKKYKDYISKYSYRIVWSEEDQVFIVSIDELHGCITHGETMEEAISMGKEAALCHIEGLNKDKKEIPLPISLTKFKGVFPVRTTPELHSHLARVAASRHISMNKLIVDLLEKSIIKLA